MKLGWAPEPGSYCHRKPGWWLQMASLQIITEKYHHGSCSAVAKYHHLNIISAIYCQYSWKLSSWQNVALLPMVPVSSTSTKSNPLFFYCLCLALELDRSMLMIAAVGLIAVVSTTISIHWQSIEVKMQEIIKTFVLSKIQKKKVF